VNILKDLIGLTYVTEDENQITIHGLNTADLLNDINTIWHNSLKAIRNIFTEINRRSVVFERFFGVDVLYILQQIAEFRHRESSLYRLKVAISGLRTDSWLRTFEQSHKPILDRSRLKRLYHTLYPHQIEALDAYDKKVPRMNLNGYLLGAAPGAGKTIISLGLSVCLKAEIVVAIVPKSLAGSVWVNDIKTEFGSETRVWSSTLGFPMVLNYKFYVLHYEALSRYPSLIRYMSKKNSFIVLDESHNFNEIKSQRTQNLITFCRDSCCKNIIFASGTPIKAIGSEATPLLSCIDPMFTEEAAYRFSKIYGASAKRANDVLRHRLDIVSYKIPREVYMKISPPIVEQIKVKIPNGTRFTVANIQAEMKAYALERMAYYQKNITKYNNDYEQCLAYLRKL